MAMAAEAESSPPQRLRRCCCEVALLFAQNGKFSVTAAQRSHSFGHTRADWRGRFRCVFVHRARTVGDHHGARCAVAESARPSRGALGGLALLPDQRAALLFFEIWLSRTHLELHYATNWAYEGQVDVLYVDTGTGGEKSYGQLAQGSYMTRETYAGHTWNVREVGSRELLMSVVASPIRPAVRKSCKSAARRRSTL